MRSRLPLLTAALSSAATLSLAGTALAADPVDVEVPCTDARVVRVECKQEPAPAPEAPATERGCAGRDLVPSSANLATVRSATACLVNEERASRGLAKLKAVSSLQAVAGAYAQRMVRERFFAHSSPDGDTFVARIKRTSYLKGALRRWSVGENIAWGTGTLATPEQIVKSWMASPGHRRNILSRSFTELGLGVAVGAPRTGVGDRPAATYVNAFGERRR